MTHYQYLIVGGGMTATAAVDGIRELDPRGSIGLFTIEADPPYNRPPLSKALWKGAALDTIWRKIDTGAVDLHRGRTIREILPDRKRVVDDRGTFFTYKKLLLATGGTPRRLPFDSDDRILYFRTLSDYRRLRTLTGKRQRVAVIGGGFIGSEIAAALRMSGHDVVMIFPGNGIGDRIFPRALAQHVTDVYRGKGVELVPGEKIETCAPRGDQRVLTTSHGRQFVVDVVVVGIGLEPNTALAATIGLIVNNGIIVDDLLRTSRPDIYAAGDVAAFSSPVLGKRLRVEHEDNANAMGRAAGRNMAGASEPYDHLSFFYSDLFELGYEAVGELDSRFETVADWKSPHEEGVIYYLQNNRVRGVLLWNVWEQVEAARELIRESGPFTADDLVGRIPGGRKRDDAFVDVHENVAQSGPNSP